MKWLIVEDALRDGWGHWVEYLRTFQRGLKDCGDDLVILCDREADGELLAEFGAKPVLPRSIWHRMSDGAGPLKRYLRVPGHAIATFFAMRKVFRGFDHQKTQHPRDSAVPKGKSNVWAGSQPERSGVKDTKQFNHGLHGLTRMGESQGHAQGTCAGASEPDSLASELADSPVSESLTRSASGPALAAEPQDENVEKWKAKCGSLPATIHPLPATSCPPDWIFVPTVLVHHLLGWWLLLKTGSLPRDSRVLLFFPNLPLRVDKKGDARWNSAPTTKLMTLLFRDMRPWIEERRVVLGTETKAMRAALASLTGLPVIYLPHPVEAVQPPRTDSGSLRTDFEDQNIDSLDHPPSGIRYRPSATEKPMLFACYGGARAEKGSDIFQEAIRLILKNEVASAECRVSSARNQSVAGAKALDCFGHSRDSHPSGYLRQASPRNPMRQCSGLSPLDSIATAVGRPLRFAIQWIEDFERDDGSLVRLAKELVESDRVDVIRHYFEGDDYSRQLARTDAMVLPYQSRSYRVRVSRVVIEAMVHGLPVVATQGTTIWDQVREFGAGVSFSERDAHSLANAMLGMAADFQYFREEAGAKLPLARVHFSVSNFKNLLLEHICSKGLVLGDSHVAGRDWAGGGLGFPGYGIPGVTTAGLLTRISNWSMPETKSLILWVGTNDVLEGLDDTFVVENLKKVADYLIRHNGVEGLAILQVLPFGRHFPDAERFNERVLRLNFRISEWCLENGYEFMRCAEEVKCELGYLAESFTDDGIHLNALGYINVCKYLEDNYRK